MSLTFEDKGFDPQIWHLNQNMVWNEVKRADKSVLVPVCLCKQVLVKKKAESSGIPHEEDPTGFVLQQQTETPWPHTDPFSNYLKLPTPGLEIPEDLRVEFTKAVYNAVQSTLQNSHFLQETWKNVLKKLK